MKKLMTVFIAILFALSMTGLCFAQDKPAPPPEKVEKVEKKAEKKKVKKAKKAKKEKKEKKEEVKKDEPKPADPKK